MFRRSETEHRPRKHTRTVVELDGDGGPTRGTTVTQGGYWGDDRDGQRRWITAGDDAAPRQMTKLGKSTCNGGSTQGTTVPAADVGKTTNTDSDGGLQWKFMEVHGRCQNSIRVE